MFKLRYTNTTIIINEKKNSPHQWNRLEYGTQVKKETEDNMLEPLSPEIVKTTQTILGNLLFYGITVEIPMLVALGTINAARTKKTDTRKSIKNILNYFTTHPN